MSETPNCSWIRMNIHRLATMMAMLLALHITQAQAEDRVTVKRVDVGEDATSVSHYLAYFRDSDLERIRWVWNGGCCQEPSVEEYEYAGDNVTRYRRYSLSRDDLPSVISNPEAELELVEALDAGDLAKRRAKRAAARDCLDTYREWESEAVTLASVAGVSDWTAALKGVGEVKYGMTVEAANRIPGISMKRPPGQEDNCYYVEPIGGPVGLSFMVVEGKIVRADVYSNKVKTVRGVGVGDSVKTIYRNYDSKRLSQCGHDFAPNWSYVEFTPVDKQDKRYRLIFEIDENDRIQNYRSGMRPEIGYDEGCN